MAATSPARIALVALAGAAALAGLLWFLVHRQAPSIEDPKAMLARAERLAADGEEDDAAELLRHAARMGLPEAQYRLGLAYLRGRGLEADAHEAARWFRVAVRTGGHARAAAELARMLEQGRGVGRDEREARRLYAFAAGKGVADAMYRLAVMLAEGRGGPENLEEAAHWASRAAGAGVHEAQGLLARVRQAVRRRARDGDPRMMLALAHMHAHGWGVPRSPRLARDWIGKAARSGDPDAAWEYARLLRDEGADDAALLPWLRIAARTGAPARKGALGALLVRLGRAADGKTLLLEAARAGDAHAALNLGILAFTGAGGPRDPTAAADWWQQAAAAGLARAQNDLGAWTLLEGGDAMRAMEHFRKAARAGVPEAAFNLALLKLSGITRAPEEAARWMQEAARAGLPEAWLGMGVLYERGVGVGRNLEQAMRWYRKAARAGIADAMVNLALLELRHGDEDAREEARKWLEAAAVRGDAYAQEELGALILLGELPGSPREARQRLAQAARAGIPEAIYDLAGLYRRGEGVAQDDARALALYRKAAALGFAPAMNALAYMHALGRGTRRDRDRARDWLEKAARMGDRLAERNLDALAKGGKLSLLAVARRGAPRSGLLQWRRDPGRWIRYDRRPVLVLGGGASPAATSHAPSSSPASET